MANIMQCTIGKLFGEGKGWNMCFGSPFNKETNFNYEFTDVSPPFPAKNFDHREVEAFRDYLTGIIDEYHRIIVQMEEING